MRLVGIGDMICEEGAWFSSQVDDSYENKSSALAEMGDRGHNRHGPKSGGAAVPFRGELEPHLIQCGLGRGLLLP